MHREQAQQAARDEKLVPIEYRVKIGKSNLRMDPTLTQKEEKYQVMLDIIKNTPCYNVFLTFANVPVIYMQQFWFTIKKVKKSSFYQFDIANKTCKIDVNVDYAALIWEDLQYQIDNRQSKVRRREIMPFPRFTKFIINHFMSQHKSISKRQGSLYHTVDDDGVLDRLKFINKGEEHQVYGKLIPNTLVTDDMKKSEAYKTFISISKILIPPKKGRGKGTQGTKATVILKKANTASKKKRAKKIESSDEESDEQEERLIRRNPRGVIIQDTLQVTKKKSIDQTQKLKGIELLSDAAQLEIDTQKAIKASKHESRFQHQSGGSSEGAGLRPEVPDEPTRDSADSDEGAGTSPEVLDEIKYISKAQYDLEDWGSTDDETFLFDYKVENLKYIPWVSNNDDESEIDDEEDDASIDIEKTDDERTDTDVEDQDDEELKADEEQKGDDQAGDEQVVVHVSTTQKETPNLLQSTSSHSVSSNFAILASIKSQVPSVVKDYLQSSLPDAFKKVLQSHTEELKKELSEKSDYNDVTKEFVQANVINKVKNFLPKFLPKAIQDALEKTPLPFAQSSSPDQSAIKAVESHSEYELKKILYAKMNKSQSHLTHDTDQELYDALTWSMLLDEATTKEGNNPDKVLKKRDRGVDQDKDPSARPNEGIKKRRTGKDVEPSKKPSKSKESAQGKTPSITSKSGKSISAYKSVHKIEHIVQMDVEEPNLTNVADDANEPQADTTLKIPKKD
ncbi:hypothetical protein Tco_1155012 [Tanacetum coccineum]